MTAADAKRLQLIEANHRLFATIESLDVDWLIEQVKRKARMELSQSATDALSKAAVPA